MDAIRERVEKRVLENYVSQDKVVEMKELYEEVVNKLESRIDKLEEDVKTGSPRLPPPVASNRGSTNGNGCVQVFPFGTSLCACVYCLRALVCGAGVRLFALRVPLVVSLAVLHDG